MNTLKYYVIIFFSLLTISSWGLEVKTLRFTTPLEIEGYEAVIIDDQFELAGIDIERPFKVNSVKVKAKSLDGRGIVQLHTPEGRSSLHRVHGYSWNYDSNYSYTFETVEMSLPGVELGHFDEMILEIDGIVKISEIELEIELPPNFVWSTIDSFKLEDSHIERKSYRLSSYLYGPVKSIRIYADKRDIQVNEVVVYFGNGETRVINQLSGHYEQKSGTTHTFFSPRGRNITKIELVGKTLQNQGGRARVYISVLHDTNGK